jgi:trans-aconitate 2-methyltransferase
MVWNPQQYLTFEGHRLRPALDLLARIPGETPARIVDLGCGTGNVTRILQQRWPAATVVGVDSSEEMLIKARELQSSIEWRQTDLNDWRPQQRFDVIYSNAALHWLPNHEALFPRLLSFLNPGGYLAVQMPGNFTAPTHMLVYEAARAGSWKDTLEPLIKPPPVQEPVAYHRILAPYSEQLDVWETTYVQELSGENPVAEWTKGSWLKPFLDALQEPQRSEFEAVYRCMILKTYPRGADGKTLLPFRRIFLVAKAPA